MQLITRSIPKLVPVLLAGTMTAWAVGCGGDGSGDTPDGGPEDVATDARPNLVTAPSAWVPAQDDHPWRDEADPCEPAHIVEEYDGVQVIEIDTTACRNQTLTQPLAQSLAAGASLTIVGFHFSLTSTAPATGHFAVALGGNVIVDEKVEIPSPAGGFERIIELDEAVPAGTSVYWHIHNHGANRWILVSFLVQPHGSSSD